MRFPATLAGSIHECPRLRPIGVERYFGALGVRRPGDWTGRFDPLPDTDPITDESFVESWGALPRSRSRSAGPAGSFASVAPSLETGPVPTKIQVKPTIDVQIESGRIAMTVDAELSSSPVISVTSRPSFRGIFRSSR